jgi:hypothetical protein
MNKQTELTSMKKLVDIKYRQQQESFARFLIQENRIRSALTQLDVQFIQNRATEDVLHKAIGADVLWQAWHSRKKRELNLQLAQILAVKERHVAQVRKAYGKVLATNTLLENVTLATKQKKAQSQLDRAITSLLF